MAWENETWVDDDGSLTVGTEFDAAHMNNIETGIEEALERGDKNYLHSQGVAAKTWVIVHNLGKIPAVVIFDEEEGEMEGQVVPLSDNEIEIHFNADISGKAVLN